MAYPSTILNNTNPTGSDPLSSPDHAALHSTLNVDLTAVETKIGLGAGTPTTANKLLVATGNGTSIWAGTVNSLVLGTPTIGTPAMTGGTVANALVGTSQITGGTLQNALIGTSQITGGTVNNAVMGSPAVTGGTTTAVHSVTRTIGSAVYPGTVNTTITMNLALATRHLINMPNAAGSLTLAVSNVSANQPFLVEVLQGTAGLGTVNWFSTLTWINNGTTPPTQGTTPSRKSTYGFMPTSTTTFDGYIVGNGG